MLSTGVGITYDKIGNPLSDGTWTYTWENGRQLKQMQSVDTTATFVYNENGLRVQKTVNEVVTKYTLHGKNVVHMTQGSNELHFFYDAQNKPAVMVYNDTPYSYVKNLQGDVVALLDSTGVVVVKYVYDAWGRPISKTGSLASTLGTVQPFRYRGYVFDEETGLYYLRSRYYSSHLCRFVNADSIISGNQYAYCKNSPVIHDDDSGFALCYCLDDQGMETNFMNYIMSGGSCGGGGGGGSIVMAVSCMTEEERKEALVAAAIVGLSMTGSTWIINGSRLLGEAFLAEATLTASFSNTAIGYFLYGATIANGLGLTYMWDDAVHSLFGKDSEPRTEEDFIKDFTKELLHVDMPVPLEFINTYVQEITE